MKFWLLAAVTLTLPAGMTAQAPANVPDNAPARIHPLPTLREQAVEQQAWLENYESSFEEDSK